MQLLLLRHADAVPSAPTDDARVLSEKGRNQARRMGRFCLERDLGVEVILSSPFLRAEETAQLVAAEVGREAMLASFLASGMTPAAAMEELRAYGRFECVMVVGHEPDLSLLAATLIGLPDSRAIRVRKATLVGLDVEALRPGGARLEFLVPARLI